jgi:glycosyltransferase involved in cell wall biosynthesis
MRILLISTGAGPWPCDGWGACENVVADFAWALEREGAEVKVLHTGAVEKELVPLVESYQPQLIHCEYDDHFIHLIPVLQKFPDIQCLITTHYAYLDQPYRLIQDGYMGKFILTSQLLHARQLTLVALSERIAKTYREIGSVPSEKIWIMPNGTRTDSIYCAPQPRFGKAICIGKIEERKGQMRLLGCPLVDFAGPITIDGFPKDDRYKGEWTREQVYKGLTDYACLVLLSKAEAHPLVIGEALAAGCAILCSEEASANLPRDKSWIRIVGAEADLTKEISELCVIGMSKRKEIRAWAVENLDWRLRARTYLQKWGPVATKAPLAPLRIALIGPGIMPIPPTGWGAVEQLIWDYALILREKGHTVDIINTPNRQEIISKVNTGSYDVAHVHYDVFWDILKDLRAKKVCITSAYPYVDVPDRWDRDGYRQVFHGICSAVRDHGAHCYAMSVKDANTFIKLGGLDKRVILMPNGVNTDSFRFTETPQFANRSVVLAKIEPRKRQHLTHWLQQVDYIGRGPFNHPNYRGELEPRSVLLHVLGDYGNFVLLSDGENGTPLVVKEAMAAGLGVVLSESAANELPTLPWVTVIPEADLASSGKIHEAIERNRIVSLPLRAKIREWVREAWDWQGLVTRYVENLRGPV